MLAKAKLFNFAHKQPSTHTKTGNSSQVEVDTSEIPATVAPSTSSDPEKDVQIKHNDVENEKEYPTGLKLAVIITGVLAGVFLVALDQTIVATAIPMITNEFHSVGDIGWYGSSYLLTAAALTAIWGKIYQNFNIKYWYVGTLGLFEIGSLICAVAHSSKVFIVGRAIAGLGVSGIFSGALVIIAYEVPLVKRPTYIGMCGAIYGMSSIFGPLIGGAFTERVSWRWCFWINLPIGAVVALSVLLFVNIQRAESKRTLKQRIAQVDLLGATFFIPAIICLVLALQWGGTVGHPWNSSTIIGLFIGAGLFAIVFGCLQVYQGDRAMIPPRIIRQRTIWTATLTSMFFTADFFLLTYYIPIYFQSTKGSSAIHSAVQLLPFMLAVIISSVASGGLVTKFGKYYFVLVPSIMLVIIGTGLITTWRVNTGHAKWIGFQVVMGLGTGGSFNIPLTAVQAALPLDDIPTGTACIAFAQTLGGAIGIAVAQSLFVQNLTKTVGRLLPSISPEAIVQAGATGFRELIPPSDYAAVAEAYMSGLTAAFRCGLVSISIALIFAVLVPMSGSVQKTDEKESMAASVAAV